MANTCIGAYTSRCTCICMDVQNLTKNSSHQKGCAACRNADTLKKLQQAEKQLKEQQQTAYVDLEKSEEERKLGNEVHQRSPTLVLGCITGPYANKFSYMTAACVAWVFTTTLALGRRRWP